MSGTRWKLEMEAYQSLQDLIAQADRCRLLFEDAKIDPPDPLKRMLGMNEVKANTSNGQHALPLTGNPPAPVPPRRPDGAEDDWIWLKAADAGATSVALAVLRAHAPLKPGQLYSRVNRVLPTASSGSIANIGTRLGGDLIDRSAEGWRLLKPEAAPILEGSFLWSHPENLQKQELAAHRRDAILHLLTQFPSGLEIVQIVEQLGKCDWVRATINKDLVRDDIKILLKDKKIRRRGNTRKWEISPERLTAEES